MGILTNDMGIFETPVFEGSTSHIAQRIGLDGKPVQRLIIEGTAIVCGVVGINGRDYPLPIISREVDRLNRDYVAFGRLAAELNHPRLDEKGKPRDYSIFEMNLKKTCAVIEDLHMEGDRLKCRMVVAEDTDAGHDLAGLIKIGYHPGYSLRGAGDTIKMKDPITRETFERLDDNYTMITVDVVGNPSFGKSAIFNARRESVEKPVQVLTESVNSLRREVAYNRALISTGYRSFDRESLISYLNHMA
jgi:hypothetical protein